MVDKGENRRYYFFFLLWDENFAIFVLVIILFKNKNK